MDTDESALGGIEHKPNQRMDPPAATFFSFVSPYQVQTVSRVRSHRHGPSVTYSRYIRCITDYQAGAVIAAGAQCVHRLSVHLCTQHEMSIAVFASHCQGNRK